jgi:ADP-ribose pyrophosphatase
MSRRLVHEGRAIRVFVEEVTLPNGHVVSLDVVRHPGASAVVPFVSDEDVLLIRQYRELEEEAGQHAGRLEHLATILTTPGFTDERIHLFAAFDLTPVPQRLEHDEVIEVVHMPLEEALRRVWSGDVPDAKSALALLHAAKRTGAIR